MTLKEVRISKKLTQNEVAKMLCISLRSYKTYENDIDKEKTLKYKYIYNELLKIGVIDEEHGVLSLDFIKTNVKKVLDSYDVDYCYLFGSYASGSANEKSDVDLLISSQVTGMDFFGIAELLREELHKKIDLLNSEQLSNNQELLEEILKKGIKIYG